METIQKTDTMRSPLLQPVIQRDYTKGLGAASVQPTPAPGPSASAAPAPGPTPGPTAGPNYNKPPDAPPVNDGTKEFQFNEVNDSESDLQEGEQGPGVTIPAGSARTFANTIGNMIQIYLPRATYGYVKIDIENARMNAINGVLGMNWIEEFEKMNATAEEGLKIPDESIKMWKAAFQHYLEYKNVTIANPETEFWVATGVLLLDQGIRTISIKNQLEEIMRQAIAHSQPDSFVHENFKQTETAKNNEEDERRAA
jgi:hypothetical protein